MQVGIGKTAVAKAVARYVWRRHHFKDGVFFISFNHKHRSSSSGTGNGSARSGGRGIGAGNEGIHPGSIGSTDSSSPPSLLSLSSLPASLAIESIEAEVMHELCKHYGSTHNHDGNDRNSNKGIDGVDSGIDSNSDDHLHNSGTHGSRSSGASRARRSVFDVIGDKKLLLVLDGVEDLIMDNHASHAHAHERKQEQEHGQTNGNTGVSGITTMTTRMSMNTSMNMQTGGLEGRRSDTPTHAHSHVHFRSLSRASTRSNASSLTHPSGHELPPSLSITRFLKTLFDRCDHVSVLATSRRKITGAHTCGESHL